MVAPIKRRPVKFAAPWHRGFLAMLPIIRSYARGAFAHRKPEARQDLIQEVIANALVAYVRLFQQGKIALAYPTVLARYGIAQVRDFRRVGAKLNIRDVLHPCCQAKKNVIVERLDRFDEEANQWGEAIVEDKTTGPAEIVAFRCDFADWLAQLSKRNRRIAESLALGNRTMDVSQRFRLSEGRVSQLRRELAASWRTFVGELPSDDGGVAVA